MLAAMAFLTPVKDIFQFLEDTTTVKITLALGANVYQHVMGVLCLFECVFQSDRCCLVEVYVWWRMLYVGF